MNETGSYPGQPWLWLYQLWYHVPGAEFVWDQTFSPCGGTFGPCPLPVHKAKLDLQAKR